MKNLKLSTIFLLITLLLFYSCKDETKSSKNTETQVETSDSLNAAKQNSIVNFYKNRTASSTSSAYHYTCPKGCSGGGDSAVACSNCGTTLVHNAAFHNKPSNSNTPFSNSANTSPNSASNNSTATNSVGVYHYTCENGCAGGSGSAGNCSNCGSTLAHNAAYHNN